jgi:hypothetical protein
MARRICLAQIIRLGLEPVRRGSYLPGLDQRGHTDSPRTTSGPRPLVTRPAKSYVSLLLVTPCAPNNLKKKS